MDLRQIQYFIALVEDGSMTRAAQRLNVVQPTLSMQLSKLEDELGQVLFERRKQGLQPTAAGRLMYRLFVPILRQVDDAKAQLTQLSNVVTGQVSFGLLSSLAESILPEVLRRFHEIYPAIEVTISVGYSTNLIDWVASGHLDAAVINKPRGKMSLATEMVAEEDMLLVAGKDQGPRFPAGIKLSRLAEMDFSLILPTRRHGLRGIIDATLHQEGIVLVPKFEVDALTAIFRVMETSNFVSILPRILVQKAAMEGRLSICPILSPSIMRQVVRIHHPGKPLTAPARALLDLVNDEIRKVLTLDGALGSLA